MHIDARELDLQDLLTQFKEILSAKRECFLTIDILVNTASDANKVKGFASMSGCTAEIDKKDNYYIIHVTGNPCCS